MKTGAAPQRILIYRLGSLGDTIVALPAFHQIRRQFADAKITVLTNAPISGKAAPLESILEHTGLADAFIHYPVGVRDAGELLGLRRTIREGRFELMISLAAPRGRFCSLRDYLFFKSCGMPKVMGIPFARRDLVCQVIDGTTRHEAEWERLLHRIARLGRADGADAASWDLKLQPEEIHEAERLLKEEGVGAPYLAASLGTKQAVNDWGVENWKDLLGKVSAAMPEVGLVLLGSGEEAAKSEQSAEGWKGPRANLCGKTAPRVSAALLRGAVLFIGHDSGPMHLAAASGTGCVAIFSVKNPAGQWFPPGERHTIFYPDVRYDAARSDDLAYQSRAIKSITVDEVYEAVMRTALKP